jgi:acetyltransferase-like isoleucine patch superfamily enzyme
MLHTLLRLLLILLPWGLRRCALRSLFGFQIDSTARIGWAWVYPKHLVMGPGSRIGHLSLCKGLSLLELGTHASIGRGNWITGLPQGHSRHFVHQPDRTPQLVLGAHAAITNRHLIDCTNSVQIGEFATFAGFGSQILTHSIDLGMCRQSSAPVRIGRYCFVGTRSVLLAGSELPDYCVLAAASLLHRPHTETYRLYGGIPAAPIRELDPSMGYFQRQIGYVD